ncbi:MAG TPA: GAF domain-containing protein [Anaerolineae bacterium]|nr:GAF domain-containing protein [Anaerolineae bacterium]
MEPVPEKRGQRKFSITEPRHLRKDLETMLSVMVDISSELDIDKLLPKVIRHITNLSDGDAGIIALVDETGAITKRYPYKAPDVIVKAEMPPGKGALYRATTERKTIIVDNYPSYPERIDSFALAGVKAVLATPIARKDKIIGVTEIFNLSPGRRFTWHQAGLLEVVAKQTAVAIENATLYELQIENQQAMSEALRTANALLEAANIIGSSLDLNQVLDRLSDLVTEITGLRRNVIFLYNPADNTHEVVAEHNGGIALGTRYALEEFGAEFSEIYKTGKAFVIDRDDLNLSPESQKTMDNFNAKLGLFVPMAIGGRVIGNIGMDNPGERHAFTEREVELANGIAGQAAVAIENARLFERFKASSDELEERSKDLQTLLDVALDITVGLKLDELMFKIAKTATELTSADTGAVGLVNEEKGTVTYPFIYNLPEIVTTVDIPVSGGLTGIVLSQKKPMIIDDYQQLPQRIPIFAEAGLRSGVMAPLMLRDKIIGTLWVSSKSPEKRFGERTLTIIEGIGRQAAIAIEHARLYGTIKRSEEAARRRAKELSILNNLSNVLSQTLELDTLLNTAIDSTMDLLGADGAAIYLLDEERQVLRLTVYRGLSEHFVENSLEIPFGERLPGIVAESGKPLIIENLADHPELEAAVVYEAFVSFVGAPIKSKGRVIGAFPIGSRQPGNFTSDDATLLESIGNEIGVAIENSRLFEAQRTISESLQKSMLPAYVPSIPGIQIGVRYASATEEAVVGGDFYDIYDIDGKYALVIGDVSGKGIEAAASTSMMKYILRSYLYLDPSPSSALTEANKFVRRQAERAVFITVFCAVYDPKLGTMTFSNAGHPYPCLFNQILKTCTVLTTQDPAIGIFEDYDYSENTVVIHPGNLVVSYTDGVIEARSNGEFFGEERLVDTLLGNLELPAQKIADFILNATLEFSHGRLTDDIAILVVKRNPG